MTWVCKACNFDNDLFLTECDLCSAKKPVASMKATPTKTTSNSSTPSKKNSSTSSSSNPKRSRSESVEDMFSANAYSTDSESQSKPPQNPYISDKKSSSSSSSLNSSTSNSTLYNPKDQTIPGINNLSDPQYCCVWSCESLTGPNSFNVKKLLNRVADQLNPILRSRGWRVKRLMESISHRFAGSCLSNGRGDTDACSADIQLNIRVRPDLTCTELRSFSSIMSMALHEITHISIGLEDIHPPAFYELLDVIKMEYRESRRVKGLACDGYGENGGGNVVCGVKKRRNRNGNNANNSSTKTGTTATTATATKRNSSDVKVGGYGVKKEKRRPLLKGSKMIDGRKNDAKEAMRRKEGMSARELALDAAEKRAGGGNGGNGGGGGGSNSVRVKGEDGAAIKKEIGGNGSNAVICIDIDSDSDEESVNYKNEDHDEDEEEDYGDETNDSIMPEEHDYFKCGCRACEWEKAICEGDFDGAINMADKVEEI